MSEVHGDDGKDRRLLFQMSFITDQRRLKKKVRKHTSQRSNQGLAGRALLHCLYQVFLLPLLSPVIPRCSLSTC